MAETTSNSPRDRHIRLQDLELLQRSAGNQAVGRLLQSTAPQSNSAPPAASAAALQRAEPPDSADADPPRIEERTPARDATAIRIGPLGAMAGWLAGIVRRAPDR